MIDTSIIVPAFNEEESVERLVSDIDTIFRKRGKPFEIIVINDCSTDSTLERVKKLAKKMKSLRFFSNERRSGKTATILNGFRLARGKYIAFIDADYQYDPRSLPKAIEKLGKGYDACCGVRINRKDPWLRLLLSSGFNWFNKWFFSLGVDDVNCGLKAFRREAGKKAQVKYTKAKWFVDTEMLARLRKANAKIAQVPVRHFPRMAGKSKINSAGVVAETLFYALQLKLELLKPA